MAIQRFAMIRPCPGIFTFNYGNKPASGDVLLKEVGAVPAVFTVSSRYLLSFERDAVGLFLGSALPNTLGSFSGSVPNL